MEAMTPTLAVIAGVAVFGGAAHEDFSLVVPLGAFAGIAYCVWFFWLIFTIPPADGPAWKVFGFSSLAFLIFAAVMRYGFGWGTI
jgi:hypothetical protein